MDENEMPKTMGQVIQIDEARIRDHLGEMVRGTVEEALNAMLDAEADRLCGAGRYERSERDESRDRDHDRNRSSRHAEKDRHDDDNHRGRHHNGRHQERNGDMD